MRCFRGPLSLRRALLPNAATEAPWEGVCGGVRSQELPDQSSAGLAPSNGGWWSLSVGCLGFQDLARAVHSPSQGFACLAGSELADANTAETNPASPSQDALLGLGRRRIPVTRRLVPLTPRCCWTTVHLHWAGKHAPLHSSPPTAQQQAGELDSIPRRLSLPGASGAGLLLHLCCKGPGSQAKEQQRWAARVCFQHAAPSTAPPGIDAGY